MIGYSIDAKKWVPESRKIHRAQITWPCLVYMGVHSTAAASTDDVHSLEPNNRTSIPEMQSSVLQPPR